MKILFHFLRNIATEKSEENFNKIRVITIWRALTETS